MGQGVSSVMEISIYLCQVGEVLMKPQQVRLQLLLREEGLVKKIRELWHNSEWFFLLSLPEAQGLLLMFTVGTQSRS